MSDSVIIMFALVAAVTGIAYGLYLAMWVFKLDAGNPKMQDIAKAIQEGASAYLNRQYKTVGVVAAVLFALLWGRGVFRQIRLIDRNRVFDRRRRVVSGRVCGYGHRGEGQRADGPGCP